MKHEMFMEQDQDVVVISCRYSSVGVQLRRPLLLGFGEVVNCCVCDTLTGKKGPAWNFVIIEDDDFIPKWISSQKDNKPSKMKKTGMEWKDCAKSRPKSKMPKLESILKISAVKPGSRKLKNTI
ncbi:hypothetical protein Tco_0791191 [Tanacetum coccineum]